MKKKLLAAVLALVLLLCGCESNGGKKESEKKQEATDSLGRYAVYVKDGQMYCLDVKLNQTKTIRTNETVTGVTYAMVGDQSAEMVIDAQLGEGCRALYYWDGNSEKAACIDEGSDLSIVKVSEDMRTMIYTKEVGEDSLLFQYTREHGTEQLAKNRLGEVSMTDDGTHVLFEEVIKGEDGLEAGLLYEKTISGQKRALAEIVYRSANAAWDHSAVAYLKKEGDPIASSVMESWQAYLWTPESGEEKLPFKASTLCVFSKNEIYYSQEDGSGWFDHYYYDGETSYLIGEHVNYHGHKMGKYLYSYHGFNVDNPNEDYFVYKGNSVNSHGYACEQKLHYSGYSKDSKTVYYWSSNDDIMRVAILLENGQISVQEKWETGEFSPRNMRLHNGSLIYFYEDALYFNGKQIVTDVDRKDASWELSDDGKTMVYRKGQQLYSYVDGTQQLIWEGETPEDYYPMMDNRVIIWGADGTLYLCTKEGLQTVDEQISEMIPTITWSGKLNGDIVTHNMREGMLFQNACGDMVYVY